jgi:hypothetical protein
MKKTRLAKQTKGLKVKSGVRAGGTYPIGCTPD